MNSQKANKEKMTITKAFSFPKSEALKKLFKDDKNMIITAASAAQRAAEHILGGSLNEYEPLPEEMKPQENEARPEYKSKFQGEFLKGK